MTKTNNPGSNQRIITLDIIRGIAVLGIFVMNIWSFASPRSMEEYVIFETQSKSEYWLWFMSNLLVLGKMRGLFAALFGISSLLIVDKLLKKDNIYATEIYYRRLIWLLIFGLIHAYLFLGSGDILFCYALCGFFLFPLRRLSPGLLIILSIVFCLMLTAKTTFKYFEIKKIHNSYTQVIEKEHKNVRINKAERAIKKQWATLKNSNYRTKDNIETILKVRREGYMSNFKLSAKKTTYAQTVVLYKKMFLDVLSMMLLGMALYKLKIFNPEFKTKYLIFIMIPSLILGFILHWNLFSNGYKFYFDPVMYKKSMIHFNSGRYFLTVGYVCLLVVLCRIRFMKFVGILFANAGRMALTSYLVQTIILIFLFFGFGFNLFGTLNLKEVFVIIGLTWLFQLIFSTLWFKYFLYGPFEWLWRSLTYWKPQVFLKRSDI